MGNYIFISCAEEDKEKVKAIVKLVEQDNIEIKYKSSLNDIEHNQTANLIINCRMMIVFISNNYINSPACIRESIFAVQKNKPAIVAFLENVNLPPDLELALCTWQAIYRNNFNNDLDFAKEISSSEFVIGKEQTKIKYKVQFNKNEETKNKYNKLLPIKFNFCFGLGSISIILLLVFLKFTQIQLNFPIIFEKILKVIFVLNLLYLLYQVIIYLNSKTTNKVYFIFLIFLSIFLIPITIIFGIILNITNYKFTKKKVKIQ